ncbi:hypothetical protein ACFL6Y_09350, partial [Elusimicrobiota bacterium]
IGFQLNPLWRYIFKSKIHTDFCIMCLRETESLILDYTVPRGLSGGPLLAENNEVVGVMSMRIPEKDDPERSAVAVSVGELGAVV